MILDILIPTIPQREAQLTELVAEINKQRSECNAFDLVNIRILKTDKGNPTTGEKRNQLKSIVTSKYQWFIDDDDMILEGAIAQVLKAAETDCDVMAINGFMTTDGGNHKEWRIALDNDFIADWSTGKEIYLRYPNHITPMKASLVKDIMFPDKSNFEDKEWADLVKAAGVLKTETKIIPPIYHYKYSTHNKTYV